MVGKIIQNLSGLYHVLTANDEIIRCRARGIFRKRNITLSAGDDVVFDIIAPQEGIINEILPRKNSFIRPNVANVDMLCYVISARFPSPDPFLIDKMTVLASLKNIEIVLILNKIDLDDDFSARKLMEIYGKLGFKIIFSCANCLDCADEILEITQGKTVVFTGNTGVGKSSILNALNVGIQTRVEEISQKLGRGRHTTREVTFYQRQDGLIGDTPGFGNINITLETELNTSNLAQHFKEFKAWIPQCQFADCTHTGEHGCMVLDKLYAGEIFKSRYQSYLMMYEALSDRDRDILNLKKNGAFR